MSTEFRRVGLGYSMSMNDIGTEISVGRLSRSRGEYHGMLRISASLPGLRTVGGVLFVARENLSSDTARKRVSKAVTERTNGVGPIDWTLLLDEFCMRVLAAETAGSPIEMVGALPSAIDMTWRLDPIIPTGKPVILYGEGGVGKSTLAAAFAVSVETGIAVIAGFIPRRGPVLYLDWESDRGEVNERVRGVAMGATLPNPASIRYRACAGPLADQLEELAGHVTAQGIALVIVDSVGLAAGTTSDGGDAAESALRLFAAFRVLAHASAGCAILAIDHVSKSEAEVSGRSARPYGSIYKLNLARAMFEVRRAENVIGLYNTKSNIRALIPPIALSVTHEVGGPIRYERLDGMPDELAKPLRLADRIANALRTGHLHETELAQIVGSSPESVRMTMNRHRSRFNRLASGKWEALPHAS